MPGTPILVIDDETAIRSIVRAAVEADGGEVFEAANARSGLELAQRERPALIVLDAMSVEHLESLNPIVEQALGVSVRETVPDWMLARADQVVSIDLPADELRQRLLDGEIYAPDKVSRALHAWRCIFCRRAHSAN